MIIAKVMINLSTGWSVRKSCNHATISTPPSTLPAVPPPLLEAFSELFTSRLNIDKFWVNLYQITKFNLLFFIQHTYFTRNFNEVIPYYQLIVRTLFQPGHLNLHTIVVLESTDLSLFLVMSDGSTPSIRFLKHCAISSCFSGGCIAITFRCSSWKYWNNHKRFFTGVKLH